MLIGVLHVRNLIILGFCAILLPTLAPAQQFSLSPAELADTALDASMPRLAVEVLAQYKDTNRLRYLDNRFRLEFLLGRYADAVETLASLRQAQTDTTAVARALYVQYDILASAMSAPAPSPFAERFANAFRSRCARLDDVAAAWASRTILQTPRAVASNLRRATPDTTNAAVGTWVTGGTRSSYLDSRHSFDTK